MSAKTILISAAVCAAVVGASGYYVLNAERQAAEEVSKRSAEWAEERAELESRLANVQSGGVVIPENVEISSSMDPILLVERLKKLDDNDNRKKLREALFAFQGLVEAGTNSIPPIRNYFTSGENVILLGSNPFGGGPNFGGNNFRGPNGGGFGGPNGGPNGGMNGGPNFGGMNFAGGRNSAIPASTRIGLIDVLHDIGVEEAYILLGQIVPTVTEARELVYLSGILQSIDPGAFVNTTITTARNLLADSNINNGDKRQLMNLLAQLGDTEYAAAMLDNLYVDGRLDGATLDFLTRTLGEGAIPTIYNAFMDANATDQEKGRLLMSTMNYIGSNAQATEMFTTAFAGLSENRGLQNMMLLGLSGAGPGQGQNITPEMAANRLNLLNNLQQQYNDPSMNNVFAAARSQLEYYSNPSAYDQPPQIDMRQIMGGGRGGNRDGGNWGGNRGPGGNRGNRGGGNWGGGGFGGGR
ncbi:MAG: hypothetical protein IKQ24_01540 [Verrucomicrobia bacterium]|nr:hypothetical protein [Verrucomicrobiota bacterium]